MTSSDRPERSIHYAWIIAITGTVVIMACLGLGRFALGMLLPSMAASLRLTYAQIGYISTGNFIGYLTSVLLCAPLARRIGSRQLIVIALAIIALSMMLISRAQTFSAVLALYFITGLGSGAANVPMMGLITAWFDRSIRGRAAGFVVIGSGFAIILSGKLIPYINGLKGPEGWRTNWMVLAAVVAAIAVNAWLILRNRPEDKGLQPLGSEEKTFVPVRHDASPAGDSIYRNKALYLLGSIYFLFGYTYVIYATFIVTTLVKERGFSEAIAGNFWSWIGFLSLFSGPVFGTLSDRIGRKAGLMIVFALQMLAYLMVAAELPSPLFLYLSIFCYGIVAWSIPSIMVAAVSEYVGAEKALAAFGFITFIFGLGQITGPSIAGILAERAGSFSSSFFMAAAFAAMAIVLTGYLRKPRHAADKEKRR
jgi:MFS family permease